MFLDRFLDRGRRRQGRRKNGVAYQYMGTTRHFHVVFDVRVLDVKRPRPRRETSASSTTVRVQFIAYQRFHS